MASRGEQESPSAAIDLANRRLTHLVHERVKIAWTDGTNGRVPLYIGWAKPATPLGVPGLASKTWRILRLTFDVDDNPTDVEWPDGSIAYAYAWDDRATLNWG